MPPTDPKIVKRLVEIQDTLNQINTNAKKTEQFPEIADADIPNGIVRVSVAGKSKKVAVSKLKTDQNNINKVQYVSSNFDDVEQQFAEQINFLPAFTIKDNEIWYFQCLAVRLIQVEGYVGPYVDVKVTTCVIKDYGKGNFGVGGTQLTHDNIEVIGLLPGVASDFEKSPKTQLINYLSITITIAQWLNAQVVPVIIQSQDEGYALFKGTINGVVKSYLFVGAAGTYGAGYPPSVESDFQLLNETIVATPPGLTEVVAKNNLAGRTISGVDAVADSDLATFRQVKQAFNGIFQLQPQTLDYAERLLATGVLIETDVLIGIDRFCRFKNQYLGNRQACFNFYYGNNMDAGLESLYYIGNSKKATLNGTGWNLDSMFSKKYGINAGDVNDGQRYVKLPVDMGLTGITSKNICFGAGTTTLKNNGNGNPLGLHTGTSDDLASILYLGAQYDGVNMVSSASRKNNTLVSASLFNGVATYNNNMFQSFRESDPTNFAIPTTAEWRLFTGHYGTDPNSNNLFGTQDIGWTWVSEGLTENETQQLSYEISLLMNAIKRTSLPTDYFIGTSITTSPYNTEATSGKAFVSIIAKKLNLRFFNCGFPGSSLGYYNDIDGSAYRMQAGTVKGAYGSLIPGIRRMWIEYAANDIYKNDSASTSVADPDKVTVFKNNLVGLIKAQNKADVQSVVFGVLYSTLSSMEKLTAYDNATIAACNETGAIYIPILQPMHDADPSGATTLLDGLHPNDYGNQIIAQEALKIITN